MITYALCIRKVRDDGYARVYIRITKDRAVTYLGTDFTVHKKKVSGSTIKDAFTIAEIAPLISKFVDKMNKVDAKSWTAKEVAEYLESSESEISFTDFYKRFTDRMICDGRRNSADNYTCAINSLKMFTGVNNLNFSDITSKSINNWIKSLENTSRAKNSYPNCISTVFKAGLLEYNDYDRGILKIHHQPFMRVDIPKASKGKKKAVPAEVLCKIFTKDVSDVDSLVRAELAQDVAILSFCLAGMNTADLYFMEKDKLVGDKMCYNRHKTESEREDGAYTEITVPDLIFPLIEKYEGKDRLFKFSEIYKDNDYFNTGVNKGLRQICGEIGVANITTYTLRHSWATIAQNQCGASTEMVGFALNHASAHRVTEGYITKDYSPIDVLNKKVIDYVFLLH